MSWNWVPSAFWKYTAVRCDGAPGPAVPIVTLPAFALSHGISSLKSFAGRPLLAISNW
jgi:hypothetical protein